MDTEDKYEKLLNELKKLGSAAIAFSGGTDSTLLLKAASQVIGDKLIAVTVVSPYIPEWEITEAEEFAKELNITHNKIRVPIIDEIRHNPENRCYLCKKNIFTLIKQEAKMNGINYVLDGTNADDLQDYRPGLKALRELEIKSPLLENGFTKEDIRRISNLLKLPTWDKPAYACLLSRIPYDVELKESELRMIELSENYLRAKGFRSLRVRCHGEIARIEIARNERKKLFDEELLDDISVELKKMGFKYVTIDAFGYKMGSLNGNLMPDN